MRGVGCFRQGAASATGYQGFPSPCGVWVVSSGCKLRHGPSGVSVPLRGVGCFMVECDDSLLDEFPSPCGVWVVSDWILPGLRLSRKFPSPCGVWVVSVRALPPPRAIRGFRPLAGCGLFLLFSEAETPLGGFRPLAGCGLFPMHYCPNCGAKMVSVPLRGVGCFQKRKE